MSIYKQKVFQATTILAKVSIIGLALTTLSACLISPYYGQKFSSRSDEIPFTVYTTTKNDPITIECAKASAHGNPYNGDSSYHNYPDAYDYITVVRVLQGGSNSAIYTFDKAGLACLGEWIGKGPTWFNWLTKGCNKVYSNTGNTIRTVFLKAKA